MYFFISIDKVVFICVESDASFFDCFDYVSAPSHFTLYTDVSGPVVCSNEFYLHTRSNNVHEWKENL